MSSASGSDLLSDDRPPNSTPRAVPVWELACPLCRKPFNVTREMLGQNVACPHCTQTIATPTHDQLRAAIGEPAARPVEVPPTRNPATTAGDSSPDQPQPVAGPPPEVIDALPVDNVPPPDELLPPGDTVPWAADPGDDLLPPAAAPGTPPAPRQVALPWDVPPDLPQVPRPSDEVLLPDGQGGFVKSKETTAIVSDGHQQIELTRLTREQKNEVRSWRSLLTFAACGLVLAVVLIALWLIFGRPS